MKTTINWNEKMSFSAQTEANTIAMDAKAPLGDGKAMTPKELVAAGLGGCTAMDVVALLKKHKQEHKTLQIEVDIAASTGSHPLVFTEANMTFHVTGNVDPAILLESVKLSQTKFCGVSAMLSKAFPIKYNVILNNENIGSGQAEFQ